MITLAALRLDPSPAPTPVGPFPSTPKPTPSCIRNSGLCHFVWERTNRVWLAESSYMMLVKPLRILLIIALALIARFLIHRMINRIVRHTVEPVGANLLRPLSERLSPALRVASVLPSERRRQRAETLGSVLRSISSIALFTVAVMLVLAELGVNLAPILASAGIAGVAIGFGAQNLVKDFLAGMFILVEDQFGVGDIVELAQLTGGANGTIESVGLRITTLRDERGSLWYIRNGEIIRVGNKSQGWSLVVVDVEVEFTAVARATAVLRQTVEEFAASADWTDDLLAPPEVLGVEEITSDATRLRVTARTNPESQARLARELRRRITAALHGAALEGEAESDATGPTTGETTGPTTGDAAVPTTGDAAVRDGATFRGKKSDSPNDRS